MKRKLWAIATHRATLWIVLAAALIFILWATAVSAQEDPLLTRRVTCAACSL
ncbi:MAG TPA: hypothetical protein VJA26_12470 [Gammaproteobacteria bacterium]|nr:hypothetical protein [Gammaproteobacteria bacterium]